MENELIYEYEKKQGFREASIKEIDHEMDDIVTKGIVRNKKVYTLKNGTNAFFVYISENINMVVVKMFLGTNEYKTVSDKINIGDVVEIKGNVEEDTYLKEYVIVPKKILKVCHKEVVEYGRPGEDDYYNYIITDRKDCSQQKRVELHLHTKMSEKDGVGDVVEYIKTACKFGMPAIAITDHASVQALATAYEYLKSYRFEKEQPNILPPKLIIGMEGYLVDDINLKYYTEETSAYYKHMKEQKYYHITLLAKNDIGRVNLYKLLSDAYINTYKEKPRIPRSLLEKYREGLLIGSGCAKGEFQQAIISGKEENEIERIGKFYDYIEVQPAGNNAFLLNDKPRKYKTIYDLENLNKRIVNIGEKIGKIVVATSDCHYINREDKAYRTILKLGSNVGNLKALEFMNAKSLYDKNNELEQLYFRTTEEMLKEFSYLSVEKAYEIVVSNTNYINDMIEEIVPIREDKKEAVFLNEKIDIRKYCLDKLHQYFGNEIPKKVEKRFNEEINYITDNNYEEIFLISKKMIDYVKSNGGTTISRGNAGSSLVSWLLGITEICPLPAHYICHLCHHVEFVDENNGYDLPEKNCMHCHKKMSKNGFNIPYETFFGIPSDKMTCKEPDIDTNISIDYIYNEVEFLKRLIGNNSVVCAGCTGTLSMKTAYDYVNRYDSLLMANNTYHKLFARNRIVDSKTSNFKHPGGLFLIPSNEYIYTFSPIQYEKYSEKIITHLDYHNILYSKLLKVDLLRHDMCKMLMELEKETGINYKTIPFNSKEVLSLFTSTKVLGIEPSDVGKINNGCIGLPEFGSPYFVDIIIKIKPQTVEEVICLISALHGTDAWTNNIEELIKSNEYKITDLPCYREHIMNTLIKYNIDSNEAFKYMERIRKGKGFTNEQLLNLQIHDVPKFYIECCQKIRYLFPKAHAAAYAIAALAIAWYKIYYPKEYYSVYFNVRYNGIGKKVKNMAKERVRIKIQKLKKLKDKDIFENDMLIYWMVVEEMKARNVEINCKEVE